MDDQNRRDLVVDLVAHLAAAISLLEHIPKAKKAAPSDKMFNQMIQDYKKSLKRGQDFLTAK